MQGAILTAEITKRDLERLGRLGAFDEAIARLREAYGDLDQPGPFSIVVEAEN